LECCSLNQWFGQFWTDAKRRREGFTEAGTHLRAEFLAAWDQLYGNGAAEADPWVWVIEFKQIEVK
jgi:hypothetical protein